LPSTSNPPPVELFGVKRRFLALARGETRGPAAAMQRFALRAASVPYGLAVRMRNTLYDRGWRKVWRAPVPVVSVGNLTVGGTGKTPCVEYVARFFRDRDCRVAILSRGYGADHGPNDEALVLEENLPDVPHLQGADRAELARTAVEELDSEVLILDDGFQHRRLARNLDVVLIDATDPWGQGFLLPRGLLREPPSSLRRAHAVVLTRSDQTDDAARAAIRQRIGRLAPGLSLSEATHRPEGLVNGDANASLALLRDHPVAAFCGLGNPDAFRRTLIDLGARLVDFRTFPDHHGYTRPDVQALTAWAASLPADAIIVTTQKDLVKLRLDRFAGKPLWALQIRFAFTAGQEPLDRLLEGLLPRDEGPGERR
jgi:tetraacyldisaccharide 4'-kinase